MLIGAHSVKITGDADGVPCGVAIVCK